jgi:hypothetical protein
MEENEYSTGWIDFFMNSWALFIALSALYAILANPPKEDAGVEKKAEFLITSEWDKESEDDVDSYLQDPNGSICFFNRREGGLMHLDRDDRGKVNDQTPNAAGDDVVTFDENTETVSIRSIVAGEYVFNTHMYAKRDVGVDTVVSIKLIKLNPKYRVVASQKITLSENGQEETVFRFTIDHNGDINASEISRLPKNFTGGPQYDEYGEE